MYAISIFGSLPFFKDWIYVRLRLCYCYSALCVTLIQTWGTLVVTGKDDNVFGFSECEIRDVCVVGYLRVYRLTKTHSPYSQYSPDSLDIPR